MEWGREQDAALVAVAEWLRSDQQCFRLFGYAGTGKTTLARHFAEGVEGTVLFGAYTGKAAYVLRSKGCPGASTIHSMIYHSKEKGQSHLRELELQLQELLGTLTPEQREVDAQVRVFRQAIADERNNLARPMFTLNEESPVKGASLVVIDECSMVDGRMGEDLLSFGTKVLVLGDPAQLPPVGGAGFFTEGITPDVMLTDIHRQAQDNPIIAMATKVRNQEQLALGEYGSSLVIERAQVVEKDAREADQILVGRNNTRHASNKRMRSMIGRSEELPEPGDKLVCLRNNHDKGLLNGAIWYVQDRGPVDDERMYLEIVPERDGEADEQATPLECEAHTHYFQGQGEKLSWWEKKDAEEFDYGYALTVHKSQGSQWDNVLLFDESFVFRQDRWRWLYTGITRAAERVTVVRM